MEGRMVREKLGGWKEIEEVNEKERKGKRRREEVMIKRG